MPEELTKALRRVSLFTGIGDRELARLSRQLHERWFPEGGIVTLEGDAGIAFFVVIEGNAAVSVHGQLRRTLGPGDHFGEIALLDDGPRTASIVAATDLRCVGLTSWEFRPFVEAHPRIAWSLMCSLARQVRDAEAAAAR
jgi:CRP/FNR family transcriptional regulator